MRKAMIVYQAGIANVFKVKCFNLSDFGREAERLLQHAFSPCEYYAKGMEKAGYKIKAAGCNQAGDISQAKWTDDLDSLPFNDSFNIPDSWR